MGASPSILVFSGTVGAHIVAQERNWPRFQYRWNEKNCRALVEGIIGWDPGTGWPIGEEGCPS